MSVCTNKYDSLYEDTSIHDDKAKVKLCIYH